jgi:hypothetical protein
MHVAPPTPKAASMASASFLTERLALTVSAIAASTSTAVSKKIESLAKERLKHLKSYSEISVSGTGLHCIARAKPLARIVKYDGVEIYSGKRFFTFTGRALVANITSAEDEVQALVDEIRTKQASEQKPRPEEAPSGETAGTSWYDGLSAAEQDELVEHALAVIAQNTRFLELEANGGNNAEYFKLVTAVARSGAPHAEDIFVKYASRAKNADTDDALRQEFSRCGASQPSGDRPITLGTLLHIAQQYGADFSTWKLGRSPNWVDPLDFSLVWPKRQWNASTPPVFLFLLPTVTSTVMRPAGPSSPRSRLVSAISLRVAKSLAKRVRSRLAKSLAKRIRSRLAKSLAKRVRSRQTRYG